jgi:hypothetical protein
MNPASRRRFEGQAADGRGLGARSVSDKIEDGGPAFPSAGIVTPDGIAYEGMSLRDWFAGQALAGIVQGLMKGIRFEDVPKLAADCYGIADAMLAARKAGAR